MGNSNENLNKRKSDLLSQKDTESSRSSSEKADFGTIAVDNQAKQIIENLPGIEDGNEQEVGQYDENNRAYKGTGLTGAKVSENKPGSTQIYQQPPIEEMIRETVKAIEFELKKNENEMLSMMRDRKISPYLINDKAKKIRFLNGILSQLKRAARLAEDFIVGLWKQYVKRV